MTSRRANGYRCGDHTPYVGEVQRMAVNDLAAPLLFHAGKYAMLEASPEPEDGSAQPYPSFF